MTKKQKKIGALDKSEQKIENMFETLAQVKGEKQLISKLVKAAKAHTLKKKPITIRLAEYDIEAIKIKASKHGLPYQTYLNMLIHKDATTI